ncbi:MAG TPA: cysteine desulfurase family protein [Methylocella sp.]|nr:cysteine desulfurase family protein [Methylocella sp.]
MPRLILVFKPESASSQDITLPQARIYLDYNASAPLHPAARSAMIDAYEACGNPSSVHTEGRAARAIVEAAREETATFVKAEAKNVVFTSGGTEALNLALTPFIETAGEKHPFDLLLTGAGEHLAVLAGHRFPSGQVKQIKLTRQGLLELDDLGEALERARAGGKRVMLALQAANNETGVIQPVAKAAEMVHAVGGILICDAVQACGKVAFDLESSGADAAVISAHKFGGPQGAGALCFRSGELHIGEPLLRGGGQERGLRAGTGNVAGLAGMAAAIRAARERLEEESARLARWRGEIEKAIARIAPGAIFFGAGAERLPNTTSFALPSIEAEVLLISLDIAGFAVSSGSACSSGKVGPSHVLCAMGFAPDLARRAIRVSLGWNSREQDCQALVEAVEKITKRVWARRRATAA